MNCAIMLGGGVLPLIETLSAQLSSLDDRVTELEDEKASTPETIWTGNTTDVTINRSLSMYSRFVVYASFGTVNLPAINNAVVRNGIYSTCVQEVSQGFIIFVRGGSSPSITRIDAVLA